VKKKHLSIVISILCVTRLTLTRVLEADMGKSVKDIILIENAKE